MADQPKDFKSKEFKPRPKTPESGGDFPEFERLIFFIAAIILLFLIISGLAGFFSGVSFFRTLARYPWQTILLFVKIGAVGLAIAGGYGIMKLVQKLMVLRLQLTAPPVVELMTKEEVLSAEKEAVRESWLRIEAKLDLQNVSDWKLAVLEADALMDDVLQKRGLEGTTMGERLKSLGVAERLRSYEQLWDAHKLRNEIVHDAMREVSYEEVKRALGYFREAFGELGFSVAPYLEDADE
ncbi:MAG: hypothetical protein Q7R73_02910 [bacterium]|nr:hypothetical protein [bacterium]